MTGVSGELELDAGAGAGSGAGFSPGTVLRILATGACYYLATRIAWVLTFPDSKVSPFFLPHAVLISIVLLVPTRHWWAYTLAAAASHFLATQQAGWPLLYALQCEAFDAAKTVLAAAGVRVFVRSPFHRITLGEAIVFVLIAVIIVPFGMAFLGAAFTVANNFGTHYWIEWRNLGISNGVTAIVRVGVLDRGVGLPDDVESLFQPFHSTKDRGLGMGLSICRTLVTAHHGGLWAERRAGRGAAFYVALPLAKEGA